MRAWLPPGRWTDVFTGLVYRSASPGGTAVTLYRDLDTIPVLAPAGAVLPLAAAEPGTANPTALELRVYAGADGSFVLAEDGPEGNGDDEDWAQTLYTFTDGEVRISPVEGARDAVPAERRYDVVLCGFAGVTGGAVDGAVDGAVVDAVPGPVPGSVAIALPSVTADRGAVLRLRGDLAPAGNPTSASACSPCSTPPRPRSPARNRRTAC